MRTVASPLNSVRIDGWGSGAAPGAVSGQIGTGAWGCSTFGLELGPEVCGGGGRRVGKVLFDLGG